jgi:hypothetical protein
MGILHPWFGDQKVEDDPFFVLMQRQYCRFYVLSAPPGRQVRGKMPQQHALAPIQERGLKPITPIVKQP